MRHQSVTKPKALYREAHSLQKAFFVQTGYGKRKDCSAFDQQKKSCPTGEM
jgi:hypothetical protein